MNHPTGCAGPCDQGRKPCPCPEACGVPQDKDAPQPDMVKIVLQDLVVSIAVLATFAVIVLWALGEMA